MVYYSVSETQLLIALGMAVALGLGIGLIAGAVLISLPAKEKK